MSQSATSDLTVRTKGRYGYGFTILSNLMRDELLPKVGSDGFTFAYLILSWAGDGDRAARLSARYVRTTTKWTAERAEKAKAALLGEYPEVFSKTPGVKETSTPETWWVDLDVLTRMHGEYLLREQERKASKRGPGRPKKPVREISTGFSEESENPVREINTGFSGFGAAGSETLFGKSVHPCSGNQYTPVREISTHKEIPKDISREGGVFQSPVVPASEPTHQVVEPSSPPHTTFSASPSTAKAMSFTPTLGTPITSPAIVPGGAVLEPPVGGTAGAAKGKDAISQEEFEGLLERANDQATNVKKIPGGAAGAAPAEEAPRGALLPPVALRVVDLVPVPRNELLSRPVAPVDSEEMQMIRALIGGKKISGGILDELTVTGGLPREDWLRLTMQELRLVKTAAQAEHKAEGGNSISLRILALDRMIGAAIKSKAKGVTSVAQYDPRLTVDQRCEVDGQALGIISKVTNAHYLVDLDDGERLSIDRALKVQLQRLKASDAPALAPRRVTGPVVLADVGTQWQPKDGGNVVTVERIEGSQRGLSNGTNLPVYTLTTKFEQVGA